MALAEIRPLLVVALIGLAALSAVRSNLQKRDQDPVRIPVRFEPARNPRHVVVRRFVD